MACRALPKDEEHHDRSTAAFHTEVVRKETSPVHAWSVYLGLKSPRYAFGVTGHVILQEARALRREV